MANVLTDLYSIAELSDIYKTICKSSDLTYYSENFQLIENLVLCDKIVLESNGVKRHYMGNFCSEFSDAIAYIEDDRLYEKTAFDDIEMIGNIDDRGGIYSKVASENDIYYSPHSSREKIFLDNVSKFIDRTAVSIIEQFDQKFNESQSGVISNINVKIPPIVEHVMYFSKAQNISIADSINEIRHSKNASLFRQYFNDLDAELRNLSPRKKIAVYQPIFRDINKLCNEWISDMDAEVKYRQRTISLSKIPIIGKVLESFGVSDFSFNDPILFPDYPHLLFINDLYQK